MNQNDTNIRKSGEFNDITEISDIIASARMGIWRIELVDGEAPRMYANDTMKILLGLDGIVRTPEETYIDWFNNINKDAVQSVIDSVERMKQVGFDENTYLWEHPTKGTRYVRCGGTSRNIPGGHILRGYHYDVDDVVRADLAKAGMLQESLHKQREYFKTLGTLEGIFYSMHIIDLVADTATELNARDDVKEIVNHEQGAIEMMKQVMSATMVDEYKELASSFTDLTTIPERMKDKKIISMQLLGKNTGWILASFVKMEADDDNRATKVIFTTRVIDEEKKLEERLIYKAQTDELTGLLNRRAYEEDIYARNDVPEDGFIYVSLDVNGLKVLNDSKGHMAGDELIIGACECLKKSLGPYGKLYRIGGDEFVAILFCGEQEIQGVLDNFDKTIATWKGQLVDELSISYGWISKSENPSLSVRQLGAIAEQRMYEDKDEYYRQTGEDRRGQKDAHKALCALYTKILKINITDDTYQIVNMDNSEQTREKGFADTISGWLKAFGKSGQVHQDDLEDYLKYTDLGYMRDYFASDKTSLSIFYRRKIGEEFKQVMMEIIPTEEYTNDSQTLFMYVKSIDK